MYIWTILSNIKSLHNRVTLFPDISHDVKAENTLLSHPIKVSDKKRKRRWFRFTNKQDSLMFGSTVLITHLPDDLPTHLTYNHLLLVPTYLLTHLHQMKFIYLCTRRLRQGCVVQC